jgi:hypothetical protein
MEIRYTLPLMEDVVFRESQRREARGDMGLITQSHDLLDPIYEIPSTAKREAAFEHVYLKLFAELAFDGIVRQSIEGFPILKGKVERVVLTKAATKGEEGADLGKNIQDVGIKLRPERFLFLDDLRRFLQHELMHVADMLDERFEYRREERLAGETPTQENLIRERYKILWDIYIDGRLSRKAGGKTPTGDVPTARTGEADQHGEKVPSQQANRFREFEALYRKIDPAYRKNLFERLWSAEGLTHGELVEMARDARQLFVWAGLSGDGVTHDGPAPGYPCPLCRFPTYDWVDPEEIGPEQRRAIQSDYPEWEPEEGICSRCVEAYR